MSINKFFKIIVKKIWIPILCVFMFSIIGFVTSKFIIKPTYTSSGEVYVSSKEFIDSNNDIILSKSLVDTYIKIIGSDRFLEFVQTDISAQKLTYTNAQLGKMVKMQKDQETFTLTINNKNPEHAHIICSSFLKNIELKVPEIAQNIKEKTAIIITDSKLATSPSSPNVLLYTLIFFMIGGIVGILIILVNDKLDDRVKNEEDLLETVDIPLLGVIYDNIDSDISEENHEDR